MVRAIAEHRGVALLNFEREVHNDAFTGLIPRSFSSTFVCIPVWKHYGTSAVTPCFAANGGIICFGEASAVIPRNSRFPLLR